MMATSRVIMYFASYDDLLLGLAADGDCDGGGLRESMVNMFVFFLLLGLFPDDFDDDFNEVAHGVVSLGLVDTGVIECLE